MPLILKLTAESYNETLQQAATAIISGAVAVIPTDTVYGLAAHHDHPAAVARLSTTKQRAANKPIAFLAADTSAVIRYGASFTPVATTLANKYWPGALTMVLPCDNCTEGFRVPNHQFCRDLLAACGGLLRVTSANLAGSQPACDAAAVLSSIGLQADIIINDGPSPGGQASTVVRVDNSGITTLRAGAITL
ncbi:MAG: threonylcarbamoyl-AMP synthase [Lentisphaerae bacterium]|jgi:L-threonylcarbamoyladenylate synthase|nr:threonylcarbamoyl-AMP synthase [Lentisphaerota bacterium]